MKILNINIISQDKATNQFMIVQLAVHKIFLNHWFKYLKYKCHCLRRSVCIISAFDITGGNLNIKIQNYLYNVMIQYYGPKTFATTAYIHTYITMSYA